MPVTSRAQNTAVAADSVAVKTPDKMPTKIMTTIINPGSAAPNARSTSPQPLKAPRVG